MSPILLVDLDDTLLCNNMEVFLPAYLEALSVFLKDYAQPQKLIDSLMTATTSMLKNSDPSLTLKNVFDDHFFKLLEVDPDRIQPVIDIFYKTEFPKLKRLTKPAPGAINFIEEAFTRGYTVVIATNPLFPLQAIHHRLKWAGLNPGEYPFALIPSYETFHFAKPNPAFFYELVYRIGFPDQLIVMVGDDYQLDIESAQKAGISAFWVNKTAPPANHHISEGKLDQFFQWLDKNKLPQKLDIPAQKEALLAALKAAGAALPYLCYQIPVRQWAQRPEPTEWCQSEILCHLRDVEREVNLERIEKFSKEDSPFIAGKDTDVWAEERSYILQDSLVAMDNFIDTRKTILKDLEMLPEKVWNKSARHAIFGPTTLVELIKIIASHDRMHLQQILQTQKQISA